MADVFISYARSTYAQACLIANALSGAGFSVWVDDELPAHRAFSAVIEENLIAARAVLVLWSKDARESRWVPAEADIAYSNDKLVQMSLDGTMPPLPFHLLHCEVAKGWNGDVFDPAWKKVLASVRELVGRVPQPAKAPKTASPAIPAGDGSMLLAVLPFDNLSSDADLDYFCDGVSEEIQRTVARGSDLRVVARSSSFQFRGADKSTANIAAALGASHLLDGTVRRGGARIRISAELAECAGGRTIWADRYDGDLEDVFALQEEIAESVAAALKIALAPATTSPQLGAKAYERFLRARAIVAEGDPLFDESALNAIPLLEEVTLAEPEFAPAWELLANMRACALRSGHWEGPYAEGRDGVLEAANKALKLDERRSGAWLALAMLEPWGAYGAREALLEKASEAAPRDPSVLNELSNFLWSVGRFREALQLAEQSYELNPLIPTVGLRVAQLQAYVGDYDKGVQMYQELHRRWPRNAGVLFGLLNTSSTLLRWEAYDEAASDVSGFEGWQGAELRATLGYAETIRANDPAETDRRIARYTELLERTGTIPLNLLVAISTFGRTEHAHDLAEKASYDYIFKPEGNRAAPYFPGAIMGPWTDFNRSPRFVTLCNRLGLCRYWVESGRWPDCAEWLPYDFKAEVRRTVVTTA